MFLKKFYKAYFSKNKGLYRSIKNIFGFYPENIFLYKLALRHKSATVKKINGLKMNNERLEFLGDALLSAIVAEFLFKKFGIGVKPSMMTPWIHDTSIIKRRTEFSTPL